MAKDEFWFIAEGTNDEGVTKTFYVYRKGKSVRISLSGTYMRDQPITGDITSIDEACREIRIIYGVTITTTKTQVELAMEEQKENEKRYAEFQRQQKERKEGEGNEEAKSPD